MSSCKLVVYSAIASAIVVLTLTGERSAAALEIKLRFDSGFAAYPDAQLAIEAAAHRWEAALADPMEVAIDIRLSNELDFFTGAESSVVEGFVPYVELRDALAADVTTSDDATATAQLQPGPFLSFRTLAPDRSPLVNAGSDVINEYAVLSSANAKALGFDVGQLE